MSPWEDALSCTEQLSSDRSPSPLCRSAPCESDDVESGVVVSRRASNSSAPSSDVHDWCSLVLSPSPTGSRNSCECSPQVLLGQTQHRPQRIQWELDDVGDVPPFALDVEIPHGWPDFAGRYERVKGELPNGKPLWKHVQRDAWVFSNHKRQWMVGGLPERWANFKCTTARVFCRVGGGETGPHCVKGTWMRLLDGCTFGADRHIKISSSLCQRSWTHSPNSSIVSSLAERSRTASESPSNTSAGWTLRKAGERSARCAQCTLEKSPSCSSTIASSGSCCTDKSSDNQGPEASESCRAVPILPETVERWLPEDVAHWAVNVMGMPKEVGTFLRTEEVYGPVLLALSDSDLVPLGLRDPALRRGLLLGVHRLVETGRARTVPSFMPPVGNSGALTLSQSLDRQLRFHPKNCLTGSWNLGTTSC